MTRRKASGWALVGEFEAFPIAQLVTPAMDRDSIWQAVFAGPGARFRSVTGIVLILGFFLAIPPRHELRMGYRLRSTDRVVGDYTL